MDFLEVDLGDSFVTSSTNSFFNVFFSVTLSSAVFLVVFFTATFFAAGFLATFFSELTPTIILVSLCSGIGKALRAGENINFLILKKPEIYIPVIALGLFVLIANIIKKK